MQDGNYIYEPNFAQEKEAKLTLIVAGTLDAITMVEAGAKEVSEQEMIDALEKAHNIIKELCQAQLDFLKKYETQFGIPTPKIVYNLPDETLYHKVQGFLTETNLERLYERGKKEFQHELDALDAEVTDFLKQE